MRPPHSRGAPPVRSLFSLLVSLATTLAIAAHSADPPPPLPAPETPESFAIPRPGRVFAFPRDHGSHPEFRIEWWYVTGHLTDDGGQRFGFQSTFFRTTAPRIPRPVRAGSPPDPPDPNTQILLTHTALLEVASGRFLHQERLHRAGLDGHAHTGTLDVGTAHHRLAMRPSPVGTPPPGPGSPAILELCGSVRAEASWNLTLTPLKPLVVFGTNGVSRKGATPEAASHYLTFSRLGISGTLNVQGHTRNVRGQAWMDHEFSSSQLAPDQVGWDWASVQLDDGREIMAYRMRRKDGSTDPFSTLAWIDAQGRVSHLAPDRFNLEPIDHWTSPRSGARYPAGLRLVTTDPATGQPFRIRLIPLAADQELAGTLGAVPYWEGACRVVTDDNRPMGSAFVELTGYAGDLHRRLR